MLGNSDSHSQSLDKWERLKQCLYHALLAFPENAKFHSAVSIATQLIKGLPAAAMQNRLSYPKHPSPAYSVWASSMRIKYPNISGTLCGCFLLSTATKMAKYSTHSTILVTTLCLDLTDFVWLSPVQIPAVPRRSGNNSAI